ncbi:MAG TPA: O-antigen ligase family protein [Thermoanaerobaculaceae bacterium]|nr:O-antigen ligase family protein [Thermoanaerobaculaceae bacterium]HPS77415.1 O-antigen ligase family protein [Thermoanaerobaculaceae bacterium]
MGKPGRLTTPRTSRTHWLQRAAFLAALVLVAVVPLIWSMAGYEVFRGPKRLLALAAWLALAAIQISRGLDRSGWRDPWWLAWAGVLAGGLLSAPLSGQPLRVLADLAPLAVIALGWGALRWLSGPQRRRLEVTVVAVGVTEALLAATFAVPRWRPAGYELFDNLADRYSWIGTLGNPADVALFLLLPCLLATARALGASGRRLRWAVPAAFMAAAIVGTRTITVLGALAAGLAVLAWQALPRRSRLPSLAVIAAAGLAVLSVGPMHTRLAEVVKQTRTGGWVWLGSGRIAGFAAAAGMVGARPLTGVGFGLFEASSYRFQREDVLAARAKILGLETGFGETHNDVLQYAAETGLIGLALASAGLVLAWRRGRPAAWELPAVGSLAIAAGLVSLGQFPFHQATLVAQWSVLAALALPPRELSPPPDGWRRWATAGLAVTLVVSGWFVLARLRAVAVLHRQGESLSRVLRAGQLPPDRRPILARVALGNLERAAVWTPFDWRVQVAMGDLAMLGEEWPRAVEHFERALALAERPETCFDVGMARLSIGDETAGLARLERAVRLNPSFFRQIDNSEVARKLRRRLDASGYSRRHAWMYEDTPAARPPG